MSRVEAVCLQCNKVFKVWPYRKNSVKYCSYKCRWESRTFRNTGRTWIKKGQTAWNKGKGVYKDCIICGKNFYVWLSHSKRVKCCSRKCGYRFRKKIDQFGKKNPMFGRKGNLSSRWKGGITPINKKIRESLEYEEWRKKVFERDDYTCQMCGQKGGRLNADHIKPFSLYPELRLTINNGRTLCVYCHRQTDTYGWRIRYD